MKKNLTIFILIILTACAPTQAKLEAALAQTLPHNPFLQTHPHQHPQTQPQPRS